jgi:hypothetical protein
MFRDRIRINIGHQDVGFCGPALDEWQRVDFEAMDKAFLWLAGHEARKPQKSKFFIQRARGHSKSSDIAVMLTWLLISTPKPISGIVGAEDKDQAKLILDAMNKLKQLNPWLEAMLQYGTNSVVNRDTMAQVEFISSDVKSSWGYTPDFVICDELTHWSQDEMWASLFSSWGKKKGILIVACNAGIGKGWQWKIKEESQQDPTWHHSAPAGCVASWFTKDDLDEQRKFLPPLQFARVWLNEWQSQSGEYIDLSYCRLCENPDLRQMEFGIPGWSYIAVVDFAEKHDYTAGIVGHIFDKKIIVDRLDVVVPQPLVPTKTRWVYHWMKNISERFGDVAFVLDKHQLLSVGEELMDEGFNIQYFEFRSGVGNYRSALTLRQCIMNQKVEWYKGCGSIPTIDGSEDSLSTELASLIVREYAGGKMWRFDHLDDQIHHDDRSFVMSVLALTACEGAALGYDFTDIAPPEERRLGYAVR